MIRHNTSMSHSNTVLCGCQWQLVTNIQIMTESVRRAITFGR